MKLLPFLIFVGVAACGQQSGKSKHVVPLTARQLNDSALILTRSFKEEDLQKAIQLFDEATAIDSNFYVAYWNKLAYLNQFRQFDKALIAAKEMVRLNPKAPHNHFILGSQYYQTNDSASATKEFEYTLTLCNDLLDTMSSENKGFNLLTFYKGCALIFLGEQKQGNKIMQQLYDNKSDMTIKELAASYLNKSKEELLHDLKTQK